MIVKAKKVIEINYEKKLNMETDNKIVKRKGLKPL